MPSSRLAKSPTPATGAMSFGSISAEAHESFAVRSIAHGKRKLLAKEVKTPVYPASPTYIKRSAIKQQQRLSA